jgi:hypothetical protein
MPTVQVVRLIRASAGTAFDLELDTDVHTATLAGSGEQATPRSGRATRSPSPRGIRAAPGG